MKFKTFVLSVISVVLPLSSYACNDLVQRCVETNPFSDLMSNEAKINTVLNDLRCEVLYDEEGKLIEVKRRKLEREIKTPVAKGTFYVGQTIIGDVASIENKNGKSILTLYMCERLDMPKDLDVRILNYPVLNIDENCVVDEMISDISVKEKGVIEDTYKLSIYSLAMSHPSKLCKKMMKLDFPESEVNDEIREKVKEIDQVRPHKEKAPYSETIAL